METLTKIAKPIMGQEAICPDGLGRVAAFNPGRWIKVDTYVKNRGCEWAPHNVELIDPREEFMDLNELELIDLHQQVREYKPALEQAQKAANVLRASLIATGASQAMVDGLLLQPLHDENNQLPSWITAPIAE